jgi:RNA polymerase sigma-70 factor (ECF subfamily)
MSNTPTPMTAWTQRSLQLGDLLARCGLGDSAAFAELYRLTSAPLLGVVLRIQPERALAEEVLQEVYVNVWRHAGSFSAAQSQPMTWLTSLARNRAIDSLRRAQTQPRTVSTLGPDLGDEEDDLLERLPDPAGDALTLFERASEARELQACMQELSASQRQSLALAYYDGLSHAEVAGRLQQPLGTVKSWVRRALQSLKACLERAARRESLP